VKRALLYSFTHISKATHVVVHGPRILVFGIKKSIDDSYDIVPIQKIPSYDKSSKAKKTLKVYYYLSLNSNSVSNIDFSPIFMMSPFRNLFPLNLDTHVNI